MCATEKKITFFTLVATDGVIVNSRVPVGGKKRNPPYFNFFTQVFRFSFLLMSFVRGPAGIHFERGIKSKDSPGKSRARLCV